MKPSLAQAATFLSTLASASITPPPSSSLDSSAKDITTVAGTTGPDHVSIHFSAPCQGCFIGTDDGLELTLEIDSADEECTSSPPRLNGLPLVMNNGDDEASGQISFKSKPSNGLGEKEVHAFWESSCLKGEASILSVRFDDITGDNQVTGSSGFTTSFKQKGQPTILRLQDRPVEQISDEAICDMWLSPDNTSRLTVAPVSLEHHTVDDLLEAQYAKLELLKIQIEDLHQQFRTTEGTIMSILKDEFQSCSSLKCIWQTAKSKAPGICKLIASHFVHHKGRVPGCTEGGSQSACAAEDQDVTPAQQDRPQSTQVDVDVQEQFDAVNTSLLASPTPAPSYDESDESSSSEPQQPPRPELQPADDPDNATSGSLRGPEGLAPFANNTEYIRSFIHRRMGLSILILVLLIVIGGAVFRCIRIHRDPRRRAEMAAVCEERYKQRLFRKAACKHAWRTWWNNLWRRATGDYEEKREMILEQEGVSQDSLQTEIQTLRNATDLVRNLVAAEEGRAQIDYRILPARYQQAYQSPYSSPQYEAGVGSSRLSDTLPVYIPPPPRYEEELEGEVTVVAGFGYPPSTTDDATESSIVDCSPRLSFETGRSTILTRDARE